VELLVKRKGKKTVLAVSYCKQFFGKLTGQFTCNYMV